MSATAETFSRKQAVNAPAKAPASASGVARVINLRRLADAMVAIEAARLDAGIDKTALRETARMSQNTIASWAARKQDAGLSRFVRLADALRFEVVMIGHGLSINLQNVPAAMEAINEQRMARGWLLGEMEDRSGISVNSFYGWRKLERDPGLSNFVALAETFGFTVVMRRPI